MPKNQRNYFRIYLITKPRFRSQTTFQYCCLQPREKVFEIDTSDQMVIPSLWASSIGLHLINIAASGLRPPHHRSRGGTFSNWLPWPFSSIGAPPKLAPPFGAAAAATYWPLERKKAEKRREKVKTSGGTRKPLIPCVCSRWRLLATDDDSLTSLVSQSPMYNSGA